MFCPKCGTENENKFYCKNCGTKLTEDVTENNFSVKEEKHSYCSNCRNEIHGNYCDKCGTVGTERKVKISNIKEQIYNSFSKGKESTSNVKIMGMGEFVSYFKNIGVFIKKENLIKKSFEFSGITMLCALILGLIISLFIKLITHTNFSIMDFLNCTLLSITGSFGVKFGDNAVSLNLPIILPMMIIIFIIVKLRRKNILNLHINTENPVATWLLTSVIFAVVSFILAKIIKLGNTSMVQFLTYDLIDYISGFLGSDYLSDRNILDTLRLSGMSALVHGFIFGSIVTFTEIYIERGFKIEFLQRAAKTVAGLFKDMLFTFIIVVGCLIIFIALKQGQTEDGIAAIIFFIIISPVAALYLTVLSLGTLFTSQGLNYSIFTFYNIVNLLILIIFIAYLVKNILNTYTLESIKDNKKNYYISMLESSAIVFIFVVISKLYTDFSLAVNIDLYEGYNGKFGFGTNPLTALIWVGFIMIIVAFIVNKMGYSKLEKYVVNKKKINLIVFVVLAAIILIALLIIVTKIQYDLNNLNNFLTDLFDLDFLYEPY